MLYYVLLQVTPSANRNSYRVTTPYYIYTQGSVLRPQPWAGETQLLQSCCCLLEAPPHALPKGRELLLAEFKVVMWFAFPFEKAGMGPAGGVGLLFGFFPIVYCAYDGDEINTKSRGGGWRLRLGGDVGADCQKTRRYATNAVRPTAISESTDTTPS